MFTFMQVETYDGGLEGLIAGSCLTKQQCLEIKSTLSQNSMQICAEIISLNCLLLSRQEG